MGRHSADKKRKALLVLDNRNAHCNVARLKPTEVVYFPPNNTSVLQLMNQRLISCLKTRHRRRLLERMAFCINNGKDYHITLLCVMHTLFSRAWSNMPADLFVDRLRHCRLSLVMKKCRCSSHISLSVAVMTTVTNQCYTPT